MLEKVNTIIIKVPALVPDKMASTPVASSPTTRLAPPPYKIKLPQFSGKSRDFLQFKERFIAIMDQYKDYYSETDKLGIPAAQKTCQSIYVKRL